MELVSLVKEVLQNVAETAASYKIGQVVLRQADRVLWVVEKSALWAVPPTLEQDDNTSPRVELIKPLPWFFFLWLLLILRLARESLSLVNLILGKPPVRPADVVIYIQSKRRYLRALKYQGNSNQQQQTQDWLSSLYSQFRLTMYFQRPLNHGPNNKTCAISNNDDDILIVKKTKKKRAEPGASSPTSDESTMKLCLTKMVENYGDCSDDSEYPFTNACCIKSDTTATSDEEGDTQKDGMITEQVTEQGITSVSTPLKPGTPTIPALDCSQIQQGNMLQSLSQDEVKAASVSSAAEAPDLFISTEKSFGVKEQKKTKIANGQASRSSPIRPTFDESTMKPFLTKMVDKYGVSSDVSEYPFTYACCIKSDTTATSDEEGDTQKDRMITAQVTEQGITSVSTPLKPGTPTIPALDCSQIQQDNMLQSLSQDEVKGASVSSAAEAPDLFISTEKSFGGKEQKAMAKKTKIGGY